MKIVEVEEIKSIIENSPREALLQCIEDAFVSYSDGSATVPPVGHLGFTDPPGDMHIKYGFIKNDPSYVIKIASGFYQNESIGLPNSNGLMMVFNAKTGQPEVLLQDEGYLTDFRTALAGAVVAKHMAPKEVSTIGIIGTGAQAKLQLELLSWVTDCREVYVYGRTEDKVVSYAAEMYVKGFNITKCESPGEVARHCNLIVTTTASNLPLLTAIDIQPGTHITAMGSDVPGKQELSADLLAKAGIVACDSKTQCIDHGETHFAVANGLVKEADVIEIGEWIKQGTTRSEDAITVADLTGIATQDIKIAGYVLSQLSKTPRNLSSTNHTFKNTLKLSFRRQEKSY
ncbi:MAG: hypothetical protein RIF33_20795 [Cyclobacteriaceae bacterium]